MTVLSQPDPTADIVCTLPVNDAAHRLRVMQALIGDHLAFVTGDDDRLRVRIDRAGRADLDADVMAWAEAEKACCAFLGFQVESEPEAVTIGITAPRDAAPTLEGIERIVRAAGQQAGVA